METGIKCVDVNLPDVSMAFKNHKDLDVKVFILHFPRSCDIIADLIGNHHRITDKIDLRCSKTDYFSLQQLTVHPDAFRSSRNYTRSLKIAKCNLKRLDFAFFNGFSQVEKLIIVDSVNVHQIDWRSFVPSPRFYSLEIQRCRLNAWKTFPRLNVGLENVMLYSTDIGDATMDRTLNWLINTSSETLQDLSTPRGSVRHFPTKISLFKNLKSFQLYGQIIYDIGISYLPYGSYVNSGSLRALQLSQCGIEFLEPGAFSGKLLF